MKRENFEDAFDEIELIGFPVSCSPFDLLKIKYRGSIFLKDLLKFHKRQVKMLAYLISRKHVPTKKGTMHFGTWIDINGDYFDTVHFPNSLKEYDFREVVVIYYSERLKLIFTFLPLLFIKWQRCR